MTNSTIVPDIDTQETQEWLLALRNVVQQDGMERAQYLLATLSKEAGVSVADGGISDYVNTIAPAQQADYPGDVALEKRITALVRWNAIAMVVHANRFDDSLGGHLASYASSSTLYEVGFNHYFHATNAQHGGDLLYIQGHVSPGIYARAYLEGRLTDEQLRFFRQETQGGVSSYPHPRTMPEFWQFPTVSMGLGPLQAIYQARFLKYLHQHGLADTAQRKVWAFCGDGEMDEPESLGAVGIAASEELDNLIFVVNCNLQRLDGPVRGNASIVRELEGIFSGAGWNVIKVLWGSNWDPLFEQDSSGLLVQRMNECVDGDYQNFKANDGAYVREHFFGKYPELVELVKDYSDEQLFRLQRGGHDRSKVHTAYRQAMATDNGKPTVILAKTVKGYGIDIVSSQNTAHNQKKLTDYQLKAFRDRFDIPVSDKVIGDVPFYRPDKNSEEMQYLHAQREKLGGYLPARRSKSSSISVPDLSAFDAVIKGSGDREISSNMTLVRVLTTLYKDKQLKDRVVTIIPDESRTLGLEGLFRQIGIYAHQGQQYTPVDAGQLIYYREDKKGQIIQEGINEAGAFCTWIAAGTSYSTSDAPVIPFYFYYSMFGFQRIGDLAWAAGDARTRGFLIGGLAGRTTLAGEGLQHDDGHSHVLASTIPACVAYDPTFGYEIAVIIQHGLQRMFTDQEDVYFYITMMNENYTHPPMPEGVEDGIQRGLYLFQKADTAQVQLLACGSILREMIVAAELLKNDFDIEANIWSATSFNELRRDALHSQHHNFLHPEAKPQQAYVTQCLQEQAGPIIAATDYMRIYADQIREFLPGKTYVTLGTDGFGISDTREHLRDYFSVDRYHIVLATLKALADNKVIELKQVSKAIKQYRIDVKKDNPLSL